MKDRLLDRLLRGEPPEDAYRRKAAELRDREGDQQLPNEAQAQTESNEMAVKVLEL